MSKTRSMVRASAGCLALALSATGCAAAPVDQGASWRTTTSAAPSQASPTETTPAQITILGSGDLLLHPDLWQQAREDAQAAGATGYDFRPLLAGVRDPVSGADVAVCHLETPLAGAGGPFTGYPSFSVPPQITTALAETGYDTCSTASNHTLDRGEAGIDRTLDALDAAGIRHAGSYRTKTDHDAINMLDVRGVKVAQLSYTFGFNGQSRPAGKAWLANLIDADAILAEAHRARQQGAAIVVVSLHWGTEYQHSPNREQLALADELLASADIDLILGCHAHVVQPIALRHGKWVVFGMGNEVAHHADPINANREGVLARFTFTSDSSGSWRVSKAEAIPVWMSVAPQDRLIDLAAALAGADLTGQQRRTFQGAYDRIRGYLDSMGAVDDGLVIVTH